MNKIKNKMKIITVILTVIMLFSLLPMSVFADGSGGIEGTLRIEGEASVGSELRADLTDVYPSGMSYDMFEFRWYRLTADKY